MKHTIIEFSNLDSTNDFLKENHSYFPHMTFIKTDYQTKGRGQFDRLWQSDAGKNLLFSILLKSIHVDQLQKIKQWVVDNIRHVLLSFKLSAIFKEPNDLYIEGKKICGILIEGNLTESNYDYLIIGIGINVNQTAFDGFSAISMKYLLSHDISVKVLFNQIVLRLLKTYHAYVV